MKSKAIKLAIILIWILSASTLKAQNFDLGVSVSCGSHNESNIGPQFDQHLSSFVLTGYVRSYDSNKHFADYYFMGYRADSIHFSNTSEFMSPRGIANFNTDAFLSRHSFRMGYAKQFLIGKNPSKRNLGLGAGLFYEGTVYMERHGPRNNYILNDEINKHNIGFMFSTELKLGWFFLGYRYENLFFDMLDHSYINSLDVSPLNSSELYGLNLSPEMSFFYMGLNIRF